MGLRDRIWTHKQWWPPTWIAFKRQLRQIAGRITLSAMIEPGQEKQALKRGIAAEQENKKYYQTHVFLAAFLGVSLSLLWEQKAGPDRPLA